MTAEDYILERIKALKGLDQPAPTRGLDLFERTTIAELENILSLLKTDRMALAKLKMKVVKRRDNLRDYTLGEKGELNWVLREINELESKSETR